MTLLEDLAVTAEICGAELTEAAARVFLAELGGYEPAAVHGALARCRRELHGKLTLAAVIDRLDDGRPGPEEAWSLLPKDEADSAVISSDMRAAMGPALSLLSSGDAVAARMAFLEAYRKRVAVARAEREPLTWFPTLGHDPSGRADVLAEAVTKGRIAIDYARQLAGSASDRLEHLLGRNGAPRLEYGGAERVDLRPLIESLAGRQRRLA